MAAGKLVEYFGKNDEAVAEASAQAAVNAARPARLRMPAPTARMLADACAALRRDRDVWVDRRALESKDGLHHDAPWKGGRGGPARHDPLLVHTQLEAFHQRTSGVADAWQAKRMLLPVSTCIDHIYELVSTHK